MNLVIRKYCSISMARASINSVTAFKFDPELNYKKNIRGLYKHLDVDYPKFFKMDGLSKLGFISVELLLKGEDILKDHAAEKSGIILTNASSSLEVDEKHQDTIKDRNNYFPSPSNFVYTLPNIMAGEAAIRHKIKGENSVMISEEFNPGLIIDISEMAFSTGALECCICGWVEQYGEQFESLLFLIEKENTQKSDEGVIFEPSTLMNLYKQEL